MSESCSKIVFRKTSRLVPWLSTGECLDLFSRERLQGYIADRKGAWVSTVAVLRHRGKVANAANLLSLIVPQT